MKLLAFLVLLILSGIDGRGAGQTYQPHFVLPGNVRVWGNPAMASVVLAWEAHFRLLHPEVTFTNTLLGTDTAMGALYLGQADLALLGRDANQTESDGFLHSLQYTPLRLRLLNGSLETPDASPAPVFFVSAQNPMQQITLAQAARALGDPGAGGPRIWGELGVTGAWAAHPLHVYTYDLATGTGVYLLQALQGPGKKMNWPVITEFTDRQNDDGSTTTAAQQTVAALLRDPDGLAVSTFRYQTAGTRALPLDNVTATRASLIDGSYVLARRIYAFVNRPPHQPAPQPVTEFLRFILSAQGQSDIPTHTPFLPLSPVDAAAQAALVNQVD